MSTEIEKIVIETLLNHWGFKDIPFPKQTHLDNVYLDRRCNSALEKLVQVLYTMEIGVVVGESGMGKSTLLDILINKTSSGKYRIVHLHQPHAKPRELYRAIASAMGVNTSWFSADSMKISELLTYSYLESGRPNLIAIDEAHLLTPQCLNELRLITNISVRQQPITCLLLFGQPSLSTTLKQPSMIPFAQRIGTLINLSGFGEEETGTYIRWQIKNAGCERDIFLPSVIKAIYRRSQGIPRMINRLALECINQGCIDKSEVISEELFAFICKNLGPHLSN
jgi:general secretion pathway protein A